MKDLEVVPGLYAIEPGDRAPVGLKMSGNTRDGWLLSFGVRLRINRGVFLYIGPREAV